MISSIRSRYIMTAACMFAFNATVFAQTNREIVVTASREQQETVRTPAHVTVLTADDLNAPGVVTIMDALQQLSGVQLKESPIGPSGAEISMRGFGENSHGRVLVLLDGQRMNYPDMAGINWLQIPKSSVERVEVVRGGASSLYGDYAVAGVVNIITRKGTGKPVANLSQDAGDDGLSYTRASYDSGAGAVSWSISADHYTSDGFRDNNETRSTGGGASLSWEANDSLTFNLRAIINKIEYDMPGYLTLSQLNEDPTQSVFPDDNADATYSTLGTGFEADISAEQRITGDLCWQFRDLRSDYASWFSYVDSKLNTIGLPLAWTLDRPIAGHRNKIRIGIDVYRDELGVDRFAEVEHANPTVNADLSRTTIGLYARDEWYMNSDLQFAVGARVDKQTTDAAVTSAGSSVVDDNVSKTENAFDASVVKTLDASTKLFARVGTVYRFPFIDEQVSYFGFGTDTFLKDLNPERGISAEVGAEAGLSDTVTAGITAFYIAMEDEIAWDFTDNRNKNLDKTRHQGLETSFLWKPADALRMKAHYTFTDATFTDGANDGMDIPLVPVHQAGVSAAIQLPADLQLDIACRFIGERYMGSDYNNSATTLESFTTVDAFLAWELTSPQLRIYVGAENILDESYSELAYRGFPDDGYYPSPDITWKAGLSCTF